MGSAAAQRHLAELLAATHDVRGPVFGFEMDTLLGPYRLPNDWQDDGIAFFRDRRLAWALGLARDSGHLSQSLADRFERIAERLPTLLASYVPVRVLLHGDLWSGNVLTEGDSVTGDLDPALYYGDAETELAFVDLFGGVGDAFWARYQELHELPAAFYDWRLVARAVADPRGVVRAGVRAGDGEPACAAGASVVAGCRREDAGKERQENGTVSPVTNGT